MTQHAARAHRVRVHQAAALCHCEAPGSPRVQRDLTLSQTADVESALRQYTSPAQELKLPSAAPQVRRIASGFERGCHALFNSR